MSADVVLRDSAAPSDPDSNLLFRFENTLGSPIVAAEWLDDGQGVWGSREIEFQKPAATVTGDVTCDDPKCPYTGAGKTVVADDTTWNYNLIPGIRMKVASTTVTGNTAQFSTGYLMNTSGGVTRVFGCGIVDAGSSFGQKKFTVVNVGSNDGAQATIRALPGFWWTPYTAQPVIAKIDNHSAIARELLAVPATKTITFANFADGTGDKAGFKVVDILVGGLTAVTAAIMDGVTVHEYGHADYDDVNDYLAGLGIVMANTTTSPVGQTVTLNILGGYEWVNFAPDVSGTPGTWQTSALTLTQSGQSSGVILASGSVNAWFNWVLPDSASPTTLRRAFNLRTRIRSI